MRRHRLRCQPQGGRRQEPSRSRRWPSRRSGGAGKPRSQATKEAWTCGVLASSRGVPPAAKESSRALEISRPTNVVNEAPSGEVASCVQCELMTQSAVRGLIRNGTGDPCSATGPSPKPQGSVSPVPPPPGWPPGPRPGAGVYATRRAAVMQPAAGAFLRRASFGPILGNHRGQASRFEVGETYKPPAPDGTSGSSMGAVMPPWGKCPG